jgi:type IV pilus assembly protein PilM
MASLFETLTNLPFLKKKGGSVVGIDISSSSIKVVQLKKSHGKAVLETYGELALGPYAGLETSMATNLPPEKIAEALIDVLRESKTTTKNCGVSMPLGSSFVTLIQMPDLPPSELNTMIPIEVRKYIPVNISEVALDWWVIPKEENRFAEYDQALEAKEKGGKVDVLVVAIHNEIIGRYQEIVKAANVNSTFFEVEIFSTIRAVLLGEISPVILLDFGSAITKLYVVEHRIIRSSHVINRGSQNITMALSRSLNISTKKAEELKRSFGDSTVPVDRNVSETISLVLGDIFAEANRVLLNYQKKYNKNIDKVVLTGGGVLLNGLLDVARTAFETEVVLADPFAKVEAPAFLEKILKKAGPEFAVALGIALRKLEEVG